MAYLTKNEIKQLKGESLEARVLYIFVMRSRAAVIAPARVPDEIEIAAELGSFLEADTPTTVKANEKAVSRRLSEMRASGQISPTDVRKIRSLLLLGE